MEGLHIGLDRSERNMIITKTTIVAFAGVIRQEYTYI